MGVRVSTRAKRWVLGIAGLSVVAIVAAGILVLRGESGSEAPAEQGTANLPGPAEVVAGYLEAFAEGDVRRAASHTDDPATASAMLADSRSGVAATTIEAYPVDVPAAGGADTVEGSFRIKWTLGPGRVWQYENPVRLDRAAGGWTVRWSPTLIHPRLAEGQHLAARSRIGSPAVLDRDGTPLLVWRQDGAKAAEDSGEVTAPLLLDGMSRLAAEQAADSRSVAIVAADGTEVRTVHGDEAAQAEPLTATVSAATQRAAQGAVDSAGAPTMLVAIQPSTGDILAVAQNAAAGDTPNALSGLYAPGSTFKVATVAAALQGGVSADTVLPCPGSARIGTRTIPNDGEFDLGEVPLHEAFAYSCNTTFARLAADLPADGLERAATRFGLNADFAIPGITTEAGKVVAAADPVQRLEDGIGQGRVQASPFGVALMAATVAAGEAVTPRLWRGQDTTVNTGYQAPPAAVLRTIGGMMREVVTTGTGTALRGFGEVRGKTGTAQLARDRNQAHGWFAGYQGDLAFAVMVSGAGTSDPALDVTGTFLRNR
ncbi:MecA-like transpeptidase family protein [Amycolatopsis cihanbeyliensis]|uniref:MecA-like transpeptidase family protein n=2 Tax=Amycolatopsis cihanbeyliensis TaxID=1128664 RepID=A0A542DFP5_AMYCI|nr:penicillin-binding transpeptidase domain-containing protein [Amycolatopsis cihanbeyliensis]TQJ01889.1 MecA-like transpeptidase family protein [Amycolatopsis cihanbeyliensis]